jgi:hypothetical protein
MVIWGHRFRKQAFSIAELVVAMALLALGALVVAQAFTNMRSSRVYVKAEAEQVAELMRSLRQQAITQGRPLGLGIPSDNGTRTVSGGYYLLEGEHHPKVVRRILMGNQRAVQISGCHWPELPFQASSGGAFSNSSYTLANWEPPFPQDGLLMFLPSGEMLTNLPTHQGEAAVVLGYSLQTSASSVGGSPAIQLQQAKGPVVVWCSVLGEVRLEGGLQGAPGRISDTAPSSLAASVPPLTTGSNSNPVFVVAASQSSPLQVSPPANPNTLGSVAPGNTGTLRRSRYISLKVTARDPDGDALYCNWVSGGASGTFTKENEVRMHYDPTEQLWVATWAWHPPQTVADNQQFSLEATVSDKRGGSATLSGVLSGGGTFRILPPGKLAFSRGNDTWMSNWDGSDPVIVARGMIRPRWSPGGTMICCNKVGTGDLVVVSPDGRAQTPIHTATGYVSSGSFNYRSNQVRFVSQESGSTQIVEAQPWGGGESTWNCDETNLLAQFPAGTDPVVDCNPNEEVVVVSNSAGVAGPIVLIRENNDTLPDETLLGVTGFDASFTHNGDLVYRNAANQVVIHPLGGGVDVTSAAQPNLRLPRMSNNRNYGVFQASDGTKDNCFLFFDGAGLSQPLQLFSFPEPCRHPDWAE